MNLVEFAKQKREAAANKSNKNANLFWKPTIGKHVIRIVPYKFNADNPFTELKFHYGIGGKTYISPESFNRPDPISEFATKLKDKGVKQYGRDFYKMPEYQECKKFQPKARVFVPIIVRGQESEGVKFYGMAPTTYDKILSIIADTDYAAADGSTDSIVNLKSGRDLVLTYSQAAGKTYQDTEIMPKPNPSPAVDPTNKELIALLGKQVDIVTLYEEKSYEELKGIMSAWLNPEGDEAEPTSSAPAEITEVVPATTKQAAPKASSPTAAPSSTKDIEAAFDNLFGE